MRVGIFVCDFYPEDYYLSVISGEFAWMVDNPVPISDDIFSLYSVEFDCDTLPKNEQELKEYLEASGFSNVELI